MKIELGLYSHNSKPFMTERDNFLFLGKRKTGKSETLRRLALDDIYADRPIVFLGQFQHVLNRIPRRRLKDVIIVEPGKRPFGLNIFDNIAPELHSQAAGRYYEAVKSIWFAKDVSTANIEQYLRTAIQTLVRVEGATFLHIKRLLTDSSYRFTSLRDITDPFIRDFWRDYNALSPSRTKDQRPIPLWERPFSKDQRMEVASTLNKVRVFALEPCVRRCLGQTTNKLSFTGKIVLIDLDETVLGKENASLLGSLILANLYIQAIQGVSTNIFIDGADRFGSPVVTNLLSLHNVTVMLTLQAVKKNDEILGAVGQIVPFRTSVKDSKIIEPEFHLTNDDKRIYELPDHYAYAAVGSKVQELDMPRAKHPRQKPKHIRATVRRCMSQYSQRPEDLEARLGSFFA